MTVTANSGEVGIKEAEQKRAKEGDQYKKHVTGTEIWLSEEKKKKLALRSLSVDRGGDAGLSATVCGFCFLVIYPSENDFLKNWEHLSLKTLVGSSWYCRSHVQ